MGVAGQTMHFSFGYESFKRIRNVTLGVQEFSVVLKCVMWLNHGQSRNGEYKSEGYLCKRRAQR